MLPYKDAKVFFHMTYFRNFAFNFILKWKESKLWFYHLLYQSSDHMFSEYCWEMRGHKRRLAAFEYVKWKEWKLLSHVWVFLTPWTEACRLLCPLNYPGQNTGVGSFSWGSSQPRGGTQVFSIAGGFFTSWTTREALFEYNSTLSSVTLYELLSLSVLHLHIGMILPTS